MLGARNGPRMVMDPVGPRYRVAGGPMGYKHGRKGEGDGTEKGVWLGPHKIPGEWKGAGRGESAVMGDGTWHRGKGRRGVAKQ